MLCYHSISGNGWRFAVTPQALQRQMSYLTAHYQPATARQLEGFIRGNEGLPRNAFVISFDDGYRDALRTVPLFESMDIRPVLFALASPEHAAPDIAQVGSELLSAADLRVLHDAGWEIGCHSSTHPDLTKLGEAQLTLEIAGAKQRLQAILGAEVRYFAYPNGRYSRRVSATCAAAGYHLAFSMDDGSISPGMHRFALPRIGIDGSHRLDEFRCLISPSAIALRRLAKSMLGLKRGVVRRVSVVNERQSHSARE